MVDVASRWLAAINPRLDRCIDDDTEVTFVSMRAMAPEGAGLVDPETRRYGEVKKGYTSFLSGDVIMPDDHTPGGTTCLVGPRCSLIRFPTAHLVLPLRCGRSRSGHGDGGALRWPSVALGASDGCTTC